MARSLRDRKRGQRWEGSEEVDERSLEEEEEGVEMGKRRGRVRMIVRPQTQQDEEAGVGRR